MLTDSDITKAISFLVRSGQIERYKRSVLGDRFKDSIFWLMIGLMIGAGLTIIFIEPLVRAIKCTNL